MSCWLVCKRGEHKIQLMTKSNLAVETKVEGWLDDDASQENAYI